MNTKVRNLIRSAMESERQPDNYINPHLEVDVAPQKSEEYIESTIADQPAEAEAFERTEASVESHIQCLARISAAYAGLEAHPFESVDSVSRSTIAFGLEAVMSNSQVDMTEQVTKIKEESGEKNKAQVGNSVVEAAKKILKRIVEFMVALFRRVQDFLLKLMGAGTQMRVRGKRILADIAKRNTTVAQTADTIEAGDIAKNLAVGDQPPSTDATEVVKLLLAASNATIQLDGAMVEAYDRELNLIRAGLKDNDAGKLNEAMSSELQPGQTFKPYTPETAPKSAGRNDSSLPGTYYRSATMPGNKFVSLGYQPIVRDGVYFGVQYQVSLESEGGDKAGADLPTELKAMTSDEITAAVAELDKLVENLKISQRIVQRLRSTSGHISTLQQMVATPTGAEVVSQFNSRYKAVGQATTLVNTHLVRAGLSILRWADASLQLYPTKADA